MMKFIKKRMLTMSIAFAIVLPYTLPLDKPVFPTEPGISTMSDLDPSRIPLIDDPEIPKP